MDKEKYRTIRKQLKQILKTKKWTQSILASNLGVTRQRLNSWIQQIAYPRDEWIVDKINLLYRNCKREVTNE